MTAILWLVLVASVSADIYSCGGFVKSSVPIDYSKVQVKLLTPEGHLKHEEECNPRNGYYMIPVYNKGQYSLKVSAPEGWYFEPETVDFKLDGVNDPCTKNEDINFSLTGKYEVSTGADSSVCISHGKAVVEVCIFFPMSSVLLGWMVR
ncbi:hypothetical protein COOONC_09022 [Cooperia oncophora]